MNSHNQFEAYSIILLHGADQFLLLERAPWKAFAPNLWTGIGGHYESQEFTDLACGALRELQEEAGILPDQVRGFSLRRAVLHARPGSPMALLLYYTGEVDALPAPPCPEGRLCWFPARELPLERIIETTRPVLALLVEDVHHDPAALHPVRLGVGVWSAQGKFETIAWGENGDRPLDMQTLA